MISFYKNDIPYILNFVSVISNGIHTLSIYPDMRVYTSRWTIRSVTEKEKNMTCFWCGKPLGFFHTPVIIGGVSHEVHSAWFNNCATKYKEWHDRPNEAAVRLTFTN